MTKALYPTFEIHNLDANKLTDEVMNVDRFQQYLSKNPHLNVAHKHTFYHLVYFTKGGGEHVIDFETFPVQKGMIYFMRPGQVHKWNFKGNVDGYAINFSPLFFTRYLLGANVPDLFSFFAGNAKEQVIVLDKNAQSLAVGFFEDMLTEKNKEAKHAPLMIATLIMQLFITVSRQTNDLQRTPEKPNYNHLIFRNFQSLIDEHFRSLKLPKDYAALLYITPAHLNAICKEMQDASAGEIIRNRIILEAKRLLINFELSINFIALELNFPDASYFVKFFKKYVGSTPEAFRKKQVGG